MIIVDIPLSSFLSCETSFITTGIVNLSRDIIIHNHSHHCTAADKCFCFQSYMFTVSSIEESFFSELQCIVYVCILHRLGVMAYWSKIANFYSLCVYAHSAIMFLENMGGTCIYIEIYKARKS